MDSSILINTLVTDLGFAVASLQIETTCFPLTYFDAHIRSYNSSIKYDTIQRTVKLNIRLEKLSAKNLIATGQC